LCKSEILLAIYNFVTYKEQQHIGSDPDRKQKVERKWSNDSQNYFSVWGIIKHGVPQGSILGTLLFIM
jgi:hypothetical protein